MANKLKIYACSGVGQAQEQSTFDYWRDNTNVLSNTQAVNGLAASIDGNYLEIQTGVSNEHAIALLNDIDLFSVSLYYAQEYSGNLPELERVGNVIGSIVNSGEFNFNNLDNDARDKHLDYLFDQVEHGLRGEVKNDNSAFNAWWMDNVIKLDHVGLSGEQQGIFKECIKSAMPTKARKSKSTSNQDPMSDQNIGQYLTKSGNYFLYLYFTSEQLKKLPKVFTQKAIYQRRIYEWAKSFYIGVYGTEKSMQQVIRNGIMKEYNATPEKICSEIVKNGKLGIGFDWLSLILAVIQALVTFLVGYFGALYTYKAQVEIAQQQSIDKQIIDDNVPEEKDFGELGDKLKNKNNKFLWIGAIVGGLWLLLKR